MKIELFMRMIQIKNNFFEYIILEFTENIMILKARSLLIDSIFNY